MMHLKDVCGPENSAMTSLPTIRTRYVRGALGEREPPFDQNAIQLYLKHLFERAETLG